jgi:hypothetical protein
MTATSGQKLIGSWTSSGRLGSLEKMLLATSAWASTTCFLTWKQRGTPQGRLLFQLVPSTPNTDETGFGLLHTPTATEGTGGGSAKSAELALSRTPRKSGAQRTIALRDVVKLWPTPTTRDHKGGRTPEGLEKVGRGETNSLNDALTVREEEYGQLNPQWVEWLMGFPTGWTDLKD